MKKGWEYNTLGMICKIYNGNSINADYKKKHYMGLTKGYPFIATKDVSFDGTINYENGVKIPFDEGLKVAKPSSVFICVEGGSAGRKIGLVDRDVCFGNKLFCLESKGSVLGPFIYYYLKSGLFQQQFAERLTGLIGGVSAKKFNDISIIYPSLSEQQSIVEYLDSSFAKIDTLKANAAKNLDEAKALFQSALKEALEPKEGWEMKTLGELGSLKNGMNFTKNESGTELHILGVGDFGNLFSISNTENLPIISLNEIPSDDYMLENEDIVFVRSNGNKNLVGRCLLVYPGNIKTSFSGFCIRFRKNSDKVDAKYLAYFLKAPNTRKKIAGNGANISNLNQKVLQSLAIPFPSLPEQQSIVSFLDSLSEKVNTLQQNYSRICDECDALKQAILRQVFE